MKTVTTFRLVLAAAMTATVLGAKAQGGIPADLKSELDIMEEIFSAIGKADRSKRIGSPDTLYLPGQGVVFSFNLPGGSWFNFNSSNFFTRTGGDDNDFDFDFDFETNDEGVTVMNKAGAKPAAGSTEKFREKIQQLNDSLKEKQAEMRDQQRKSRELQRKQGAEAELDRISKATKTLGDEMSTLVKEIAKTQSDYLQERNATTSARNKELINSIFDTLCKYGKTLLSLPSGEHLNLVLRNAEAQGMSRLYVLDASAVKNCNSGASLQQQGKSYTM